MDGLLNSASHTVLTGSISFGRFGHAMAAMGDLDYDSYEGEGVGAGSVVLLSVCVSVCVRPDLVVSAPFAAPESDEPGTIYVYLGSASGVVPAAAQVIRGSDLNLLGGQLASLRSFGAALSGDTDIDGNMYNGGGVMVGVVGVVEMSWWVWWGCNGGCVGCVMVGVVAVVGMSWWVWWGCHGGCGGV